jgi:serine/threonine protein kinase
MVDAKYWIAPEIARKKEGSTKSDVWSAGILILDLLDGVPPYTDLDPLAAISAIASKPPPRSKNLAGISEKLLILVNGYLQVKEEDRMDIKSLLQVSFEVFMKLKCKLAKLWW